MFPSQHNGEAVRHPVQDPAVGLAHFFKNLEGIFRIASQACDGLLKRGTGSGQGHAMGGSLPFVTIAFGIQSSFAHNGLSNDQAGPFCFLQRRL